MPNRRRSRVLVHAKRRPQERQSSSENTASPARQVSLAPPQPSVEAPAQSLAPANMLRLSRKVGNRALSRFITDKSGSALPVGPKAQLALPAVQREDEQEDDQAGQYDRIAGPKTVTISLGAPANFKRKIEIHSYDDLGKAYDTLYEAMLNHEKALIPDSFDNPYKETWYNHFVDVGGYAAWYLKEIHAVSGDSALQPPFLYEIEDFRKTARNVKDVGEWAHQEYTWKQTAFRDGIAVLTKQLKHADDARRDVLQAKFLGGEPEADNTTGMLWAMGDNLASLNGALIDATRTSYNVALLGGNLIPKAVTLANVIANWAETSPAMAGTAFESLAPLNNVVNLGGAAHGLLGSPGSIATAHIGPMLGAITVALGKLQMRMIEKNDEWAAQYGTPLYSGAEPGGSEMWDYMVRAIRAESPDDIAKPTGEVYEYFDDHREQFDSHTGSRMPTDDDILTGVDVSPSRFPNWLFYNRDKVWVLLYGSREQKKTKTYD